MDSDWLRGMKERERSQGQLAGFWLEHLSGRWCRYLRLESMGGAIMFWTPHKESHKMVEVNDSEGQGVIASNPIKGSKKASWLG